MSISLTEQEYRITGSASSLVCLSTRLQTFKATETKLHCRYEGHIFCYSSKRWTSAEHRMG